jgi:hypothetical protein
MLIFCPISITLTSSHRFEIITTTIRMLQPDSGGMEPQHHAVPLQAMTAEGRQRLMMQVSPMH